MENLREIRQALEKQILSPNATHAASSKGRSFAEPECDIRTCFQRDIDRIIHSKAFRRLKHKTQVFLRPEGDHYRTRLTHTLEVSRISRTVARALSLNEDLTEAIALGHDLGHTPFGHAGERVLDQLLTDYGGFKHNEQSLRVVDKIERDGRGLNLTFEVRNGILTHTGDTKPDTHEGAIVKIADRIAYINHDIDDSIRAGILRESDLPGEIRDTIGKSHSERINSLICALITQSDSTGEVAFSAPLQAVFDKFRDFMFQNVYLNVNAKSEESKVGGIVSAIFRHYQNSPHLLPNEYRLIEEKDGLFRAVADYVSGMTDKYAIHVYEKLFIPEAWQVR